MTEIRPFHLAVPQERIDDLHRRLDAVRWPEKETVDDWSQGTPLAMLKDLVAWWRHGYDWRACEARFNALGQFVTEIDGLDIHFLHVRSPEPDALPLVLTHGWPGSVIEFMRVVGPLTDPVAHGGAARDAFHVVLPSLPGYGFSGKPARTGWGVERIARAWAELMRRLGHARWAAQGGDWGAFVTHAIGGLAPEGCIGIHLNMPIAEPTEAAKADPTPADRHAFARMAYYRDHDSGYAKIQGTRPQSLGYGLVDSPVALAGWIFEKLHGWSDNHGHPCDVLGRDAVLDNIMLYWLPAAGASAARLYWESFGKVRPPEVHLPAGISTFPKDILPAPRAWVERRMKHIVYWNELDRGGHFAAWEQPELFVNEVRRCFALMR
ncbi:epoxide hydrolase family protein [Novosphingobium album (ex Liu et al. 2023)]|uniref:Epoxide hydrolase n=1 Tax=Novosphingobium album (ex Liu et al. 2023) TaxID=3031130 RepID=A0ABT5WUW5_9SPHN|nr:epoxide hydrolase family protein [Novosphingobium album (ex Liu et al. 2023)]MDE8653666.1 epoxide hydrolase [Novosphingobium album (ex Liu et al. 2023)]